MRAAPVVKSQVIQAREELPEGETAVLQQYPAEHSLVREGPVVAAMQRELVELEEMELDTAAAEEEEAQASMDTPVEKGAMELRESLL